MAALLDSFPFPHNNPIAQELHQVLCQIHPTLASVQFVTSKAGLDMTMVNTNQPVFYIWNDILDFASRQGTLRILVEQVFNLLGPLSPLRDFLNELLQDRITTSAIEPRGADGAPIFISKSDDVFEEEALLYHDDLTLQMGKVPALIFTLQKLNLLSPAVCKFSIDFDGRTKLGTGFRIGENLLLTNWHVLHLTDTGKSASKVTAEFIFEDDGQGGLTSSRNILCDPTTILTDREDDWAVIQTLGSLDPGWPIVPMDSAVDIKEGDAAFIIQHPSGARKRLGFVRNQVSFFDERVVHYLTDTQEGSSGAPVFDSSGRLFAIHHAGGRPQEVAGKAPLRKNEGIRISRVLDGLKAAGVKMALE